MVTVQQVQYISNLLRYLNSHSVDKTLNIFTYCCVLKQCPSSLEDWYSEYLKASFPLCSAERDACDHLFTSYFKGI